MEGKRLWVICGRLLLMALGVCVGVTVYSIMRQSAEVGKNADCVSNMRQLAYELLAWQEDHEHRLPAAEEWPRAIAETTRSHKMSGNPFDCDNSRHIGSLAKPDYFMIAGPEGAFLSRARMADITAPAETPLLAELDNPGENFPYLPFSGEVDLRKVVARITLRHRMPGRRGTGTHMAFCDGHVRFVPEQEVTVDLFTPCRMLK